MGPGGGSARGAVRGSGTGGSSAGSPRGYQASRLCTEPRSPSALGMGAPASRPACVALGRSPPALGSSPVRREMFGRQVSQTSAL